MRSSYRNKTFTECRELLSRGEFGQAQKKIKNWVKKNSPTPEERVALSEFYMWMGQEEQSWKVLGPPKTSSEIAQLNSDELCVQLRLAYVLGMLGCRYVARHLSDAAFEVMKGQGMDVAKLYPQFYQNYGYRHIITYEYSTARWGFEQALKLYPRESYQYFFISLGLCDCDSGEGNLADALERVEKLLHSIEDRQLLWIALQAKGEYLNFNGQVQEAYNVLQESLKLVKESELEQGTKDYAYLLKHLGVNFFLQGESDRALDALEQAKGILEKLDQTPNALMEVLFWIEKCSATRLSLEEQVTLRCYPIYSIYSQMAGRLRAPEDKTPLPPWLVPYQYTVQHGDAWLLSAEGIEQVVYGELRNELKGRQIDLYSACLIEEGQVARVLTPLQVGLLQSLIGGGRRGVHEYLLLDRSYRQEFIDYQSALDRLKKAIRELGKLGFTIKKSKSTYVLELDISKVSVIFPKDLNPREAYSYLSRLGHGEVSVELLVHIFNIHERTAQRWMKSWREQNILQQNGNKLY